MIRKVGVADACALGALLAAVLGGADVVARALAAAAGTAFEAAPFLLLACVLERGFAERLPAGFSRACAAIAQLGGCGCTRGRLPGALSIAAFALTLLAFGPLVAAARTAAACVLAVRRERAMREPSRPVADPFAELETLAGCAFLAALAIAALGTHATALPWAGAIAVGIVLGMVAPCATAGIAVAAAFAHGAPGIAMGMLCTTALAGMPFVAKTRAASTPSRPVPVAAWTLGAALAAIVVCGPSGLVNPRLFMPIGLASVAAFVFARSLRTASARPALVPLAMCGALVSSAPPPLARADATRLDDAFAGQRLDFVGVAHAAGNATSLTRYAITCCRLDASPVSVRLLRRLNVADGRWVDARGTLVATADGSLSLRPEAARVIVPPADPFVYR